MPLPGPILYGGCIWIGPAAADNYMAGRRGNKIQGIVAHHTACSLQAAINRFTQSPAISGGGASAHFIIDLDGTRYQVVDTDDTAFQAGDFQINLTTIGIEHVQTWDYTHNVKTSDFTDAQYQSSHELCTILATDNGFSLADHLWPHRNFTQTDCPGDLDLNRIISGQGGGIDLTPDESAKLNRLDLYWYDDGSGGGGTLTKAFMGRFNQLDTEVAALKAGSTDLAPVLSAIADLKAHPAVASDPALLATVNVIAGHFSGK